MGKSGEISGEDFSTCQESMKKFGASFGANFGEIFRENFGNFVSNFATFFGNFVQQKGGANKVASDTKQLREEFPESYFLGPPTPRVSL